MELIVDKEFEKKVGHFYGRYLGTFYSDQGQVRADLFEEGVDINAYISFPTGQDMLNVQDRYVTPLREYADRQGFADRFHLIFAA
jgi:hypothetical protein